MSMSQKKKIKELEARIEALEDTLDQVMEYLENSQSQSESPKGKD